MFEAFALIPWLLIAGFWIFVIWAVLALIGVLREIVSELRAITDALRGIAGRGSVGRPEA